PGRINAVAKAGVAGVKGTEFAIAVENENGREILKLYVIDGEVQFTNALGTLTLTNGEQATLEAGLVPARSAKTEVDVVTWANNLLQWAFYYPAVLDPRDLGLTADETQALGESLIAYRAGDLPAALAALGERKPATDSERIYHAAVLLSVGKVDESAALLAQVEQANAPESNLPLA